MSMEKNPTRQGVRDYYGKVLQTKADLKTDACCVLPTVPDDLQAMLRKIHPEVSARFYGCGTPFPEALSGQVVLDLGCGSGRDAFVLSNMVGPRGRVVGVDMTAEQLAVAREHQDYHRKQWGHRESNITFYQGYLEDLASLGIADHSVDVVVSNCVINLSPDKPAVFREIFRVLKPGGELYFSDVFADRRIPSNLSADPVLVGECLAGAMYREDLRRLLYSVGCSDIRLVAGRSLNIEDPEVFAKVAGIGFSSLTLRAFNLNLEDRSEDYGQQATYLGTIPGRPREFHLDECFSFAANRPVRVCGNTAAILGSPRLAEHFRIQGDRSRHYGLFSRETDLKTETKACC